MRRKHVIQFFYQLVRGILNPEDVSRSIKIGDILQEAGTFKFATEKVRTLPGGQELFKNRNLSIKHDLDFFSRCPQGSLGFEYFKHLKEHNLDPTVLTQIDGDTDEIYLENLVRQTHDIFHVITGFDTSVDGEIGLQAFMAKQMNWPFSMVSIGGASIITLLNNPENIENYMDHIHRGYQLALQLKPLILVDWSELWFEPLEQVKSDLGFPPENSSSFTWKSVPATTSPEL